MAIRIVTGAPCSGKTSYVQSHAVDGEVIIDYDLIAKAIGASDHRPSEPYRSTAFVMRRAGIDDVLEKGTPAWIIHTDPSAQQVAKYAAAGAEFIHMDASMEECLERAKDRPDGTAEAIRDYFAAREEKGVPAMETKSIDLLVKEAPGDVPGIIAYASTFDRIPDAYGDVVAKGAFDGTLARLKESGNNLPLLYGHVMDQPENIIGTVVKAEEDDHGLLVEAVFDMENPKAQTVHRAVLSKAITKLSFAFSVLDDHTITLEDYGEVRELTELEIYEVSLVVVPANPRAQVVAAKDAEPETKTSEEIPAVDTAEPETSEVKAEEPVEAKAEEPEGVEANAEHEQSPIVSEKEQTMEIETMNAIAGAAPVEKSLTEIVAETFVGKRDGGRFTLATPEIKAATWMGTPAIQEITREVPALKKPLGIADAFSTIVISGNTYVYVPVTPKDGAFAAVAEGAAKPLVDYNKTPVVVPLTKFAGIMKFSDEIMEDAEWLVSEITGQGEWDLERSMDAGAWSVLSGASGIGSFTATSDMVNDAIKAAAQAYAASGYKSDVIFMNPVDFAAAKVASRSMPGEAYISADGIDRLTVIESDQVASGTAIVGNSRFAKRILKGGRRVESTNSNDTDFEHNLVTIRVEQRGAFVITMPQAFVKIASA